jgi:hypothetical protein
MRTTVVVRLLRPLLVPSLFLLALACDDPQSPAQPPDITPADEPLAITPVDQTLQVPRSLQLSTQGGGAAASVVWESTDTAVASVSASGLVSARFPGSATITARNGRESATLSLTVTAAWILVEPNRTTLALDGTQTLTATVIDANGTVLGGVPIRWSTENAIIATVDDSTGVVTGRAPGSTTITATGGGVSGSVRVDVGAPSATGLVWSLIDPGGHHTCGLEAATGLAYCWGDNHAGALGVDYVDASDSPVLVGNGAQRFSGLSAGFYATCGVEAQTGFAYCWGRNSFGELGDNTTATRWVPTLVAGRPIRFSGISASWGLTCGVEAETGLGHCWGRGGLIGDGTLSQRLIPTPIGGGALRFSSISVGGVWAYSNGIDGVHACGIEAQTGHAYCWGASDHGELGDGTTTDRLAPALVGGGSRRFSSIDAGDLLTCGVEAETGHAYCWGQNNFGQVGDGTTTDRLVPTLVGAGSRRFISVDAGDLACGIEAETGFGYCWGRGNPVPTPVGAGALRFSSMIAAHGWACGVEAQTGAGYCWDHALVPTPVPAAIVRAPASTR